MDTVRKAYDEAQRNDLVRTIHGVGTFTAVPSASGQRDAEDAWERADRALFSLAKDGLDIAGDAAVLGQRLAVVQKGVRAVFFGVAPSASRYERQINALLPEGLQIRSVDINALREGRVDVEDLTHAICLPLHRREIESLLQYRSVRCLTLVRKLAPGLVERIPSVKGGRKIILVARPETAPIFTSILAAERPDLASPIVVLDTDEASLHAQQADADVIIHTTLAASMVRRIVGGTKHLIELEHVPEPGSLETVAGILIKDQQLQQELLRTSAYRELL